MGNDDFRFWILLLTLCFLFAGEPDVWDRLHDRAMAVGECK